MHRKTDADEPIRNQVEISAAPSIRSDALEKTEGRHASRWSSGLCGPRHNTSRTRMQSQVDSVSSGWVGWQQRSIVERLRHAFRRTPALHGSVSERFDAMYARVTARAAARMGRDGSMLDVKRALASAQVPERTETFALITPWGEAIERAGNDVNILPEHPHPTMVRERYAVLNGMWEYAIVPDGRNLAASSPDGEQEVPATLPLDDALALVAAAEPPLAYQGQIRVPFSPEAALSGVGRHVQPDELLWYRRAVPLPPLDARERLILHFEAVDWVCAVHVNGHLAATHAGSYLPFEVDITPYLGWGAGGTASIAVCVYDPSDAGVQPRGKQRLHPGGIWYTAQSGIWQSVWWEVVSASHVVALTLEGDARGTLDVEATCQAAEGVPSDAVIQLELHVIAPDGTTAAHALLPFEQHAAAPPEPSTARFGSVSRPTGTLRHLYGTLAIAEPLLWSPDHPHRYRVEATLRVAGDLAEPDRVRSYTAFRTVEIRRDETGVPRVHLNGEPILLKGVLDQGYWPESLMTAPSDEALVADIAAMRRAGFNMLRKHLKIESARWYYHCDRLGMLVWQDAVSGGGSYSLWHTSRKPTVFKASWRRFRDDTPRHRSALAADDADYRREWTATVADMVRLLKGHPSIITWSLFNEGLGQFDARAASELVHTLDPSRPIDAVSGWFDQHCGDYLSHHNYFRPLTVDADRGNLAGYAHERGYRAFMLSEFGGWAQPVEGHRFSTVTYGYGDFPSLDAWRQAVRASLDQAEALSPRGLAGFIYTQLSDVEDETNGILTYDRRVNKLEDRADGCP